MDRKAIAVMKKMLPKKIVYISCNPKTLARDVVVFRQCGYDTDTVQPVDMFPHTHHVENGVKLIRR